MARVSARYVDHRNYRTSEATDGCWNTTPSPGLPQARHRVFVAAIPPECPEGVDDLPVGKAGHQRDMAISQIAQARARAVLSVLSRNTWNRDFCQLVMLAGFVSQWYSLPWRSY